MATENVVVFLRKYSRNLGKHSFFVWNGMNDFQGARYTSVITKTLNVCKWSDGGILNPKKQKQVFEYLCAKVGTLRRQVPKVLYMGTKNPRDREGEPDKRVNPVSRLCMYACIHVQPSLSLTDNEKRETESNKERAVAASQ